MEELRSKVICFASPKGGSGKTTITATIGTFLSTIGKRILLIDADAATNGMSIFYLREISAFSSTHGVGGASLMGVFEADDKRIQPDTLELSKDMILAPAAYHFGDVEHVDLRTYEVRIRSLIQSTRSQFDYILLDSQAGSDEFVAVNIDQRVCDEVVIVTEYDPVSLAGVERLKALFSDQLSYDRTWILINKMLPEFIDSFRNFMEVARYASPIPWNVEVVRAYSRRSLALDMSHGNDYTLALIQTIKSLFDERIASDVDSWKSKLASVLREPLEKQHALLEKQLSIVRDMSLRRYMKGERRRILVRIVSTHLWLSPIVFAFFIFVPYADLFSISPLIIQLSLLVVVLGYGFGVPYLAISRRHSAKDAKAEERSIESQKFLRRRLHELETLMAADLKGLMTSERVSEVGTSQ